MYGMFGVEYEDFLGHDDHLYKDVEDDGEWQPGQCDNCYGETVQGPLGPVHCACTIGQGAATADCTCGPPDGDETAIL